VNYGWVLVVQAAAVVLFFFGIWLFIITLRAAKWSGLLRLFGRRREEEMTPARQRRWVRGLRTLAIVWVLGCLYALVTAYRFFLA
jgi:hypothetical protein